MFNTEHKGRSSLDMVPVRNVKATLRRGETEVQKLNPTAGDVLNLARAAAEIEPKQMADEMKVSHSYVLRGLAGQGDLGFAKLWELSDKFWLELVLLIAIRRGFAAVRRQIIVDLENA
jgi:hypothetical protein